MCVGGTAGAAERSTPTPLPATTPLPQQTLVDPQRHTYEVSSEMSIEFEVDGPYKVGGWKREGKGRERAAECDAP